VRWNKLSVLVITAFATLGWIGLGASAAASLAPPALSEPISPASSAPAASAHANPEPLAPPVPHLAPAGPSGAAQNPEAEMVARALAATRAAGLPSNVIYVPHPSASPAQIAQAAEGGATAPLYTADPAPMGLADYGLSNTNSEVYVANSATDNVSLISDPTNTVVANIPVQEEPNGLVYDPGNGEVYVADENSNNVSVIDGTTVVATVPVGSEPFAVTYDPANAEIFVVNTGSANVSVISDTTDQVVANVAVGTNPTGAAYDPANGDVYVANLMSDNVSVISGSTTTVVATVTGLGTEPYDPVYDDGNGEVYVTNLVSGAVSVINGNNVTATIPLGPYSAPRNIVYDAAEGELFVTLASANAVSVIRDSDNTVVATIPVGDQPIGLAFDSSNGNAYVANVFSNNVSVVSSATNTVVATIPVGTYPLGVAYDSGSGAGALTPSVLTTSGVSGTIDVNSTGVQGQDLYQNTPDAFSIQLNAVLTNVDILGDYGDTYWAQDIVTYYPATSTMVLITNVWNFSAPMAYMNASTIVEHGSSGTDSYGKLGFYFAEYTVPWAITYPFDVTLTMNASIGSYSNGGDDQVQFSTYVTSPVYTFDPVIEPSWDFVAFESEPAGTCSCTTHPSTPLQFTVSPAYNPVGLLDDLELVVCGPGGGSNVDLGSADATLGLEYWNDTLEGYSDIPAAYNYGSDTGETSMNANVDWMNDPDTSPIGLNDYATMTTGPSVMSGLWGTGAPGGSDSLLLNVTPSNAFIFVRYIGTTGWDQPIVDQGSFVPSMQTRLFSLMPGTYQISVALSDWRSEPQYIEPVTKQFVTLSDSQLTVYTDVMERDSSIGVVTPLWAFSNSQLAAISQSGAGTPSNPYLLSNNPQVVDGQISPLDTVFGSYNDYSFPVFPGVFLMGTTDSVELNNSTSFEVNNAAVAGGKTSEPTTPYQSLPAVNDLQFWFWNVSGVALTNATNISGWFADQASLPLTYNSFNVIFYNSGNNLVANDTFATESQALLMYSSGLGGESGGSNTVWGNRFIQIDPSATCPGPAACFPLFPYNGGLGLEVGEDGDLVYNNVFDTPTTAWLLPLNLYTGAPVSYLNDAWNVAPEPASIVAYVSGFPGIPLTGSIVGGTTQGGNAWWDYGVTSNFANGADNPTGVPYDENAPTLISGSTAFPCPTPYYCQSYLYPVGDAAPLTPAGAAVTFAPQGVASGTVWGALVSCNIGSTQKNAGGGGTQKNAGGGGPPATVCCPGATQKNAGGGGTQKNAGGGGPPGCGGPDPPPSVFADFETNHTFVDLVLPDGEFNWTPNVPTGYTSTTGAAFVVPPNAPSLPPVSVTVPYASPGSGVVTFTENGLPPGLSWQVTLGGTVESLTTDGGADSLFFTELNGTYLYNIGTESGFVVTPSSTSGSLTVASAPVTLQVTFSRAAVSVSPSQGPVGASVTVSGTGFTESSPLASLVFDGITISSCSSGSLTTSSLGSFTCTLRVTSGMSGTTVTATDASGPTATATFTITTPTIAVSPTQGPVGATAMVTGTGFSDSTTLASLSFGGRPISSCTSGSLATNASGSFSCTLAVPSGTTTSVIRATDAGGGTATTTFTVTSVAIRAAPSLGPVGALVTVTGTGFSASTMLASLGFDGVTISACSSGSLVTTATGSFSCTLTVPSGTTSATVTATDAGGQVARGVFFVTTPIIAVLPSQGPVGAAVLLVGAGFSVSSTVRLVFDGAGVSGCVGGSLTTSRLGLFECTLTVPSGTSSTLVTATDVGGRVASAHFAVTTPKITVSPSQGPVGATVTVAGTGFSEGSRVALVFDGVGVTHCTSGSLTTNTGGTFSCTFKVPAHTSGTTVSATDVGGQVAVGKFTVT
jgi:thermopsin